MEFKRVDIVLVPLDHLAIRHGGGLDGDEPVEPVMGQDEAAGMLREMAGRADELTREIEREPQPAINQVEIDVGRRLRVDAQVAPPTASTNTVAVWKVGVSQVKLRRP